MIRIDIKAAVMLLVTLLLGVALGALGTGALSRYRTEEVQQLRRPPGFVAHMEEVIQPRDSTQRVKVDSILTAAAARNDSILQRTNDQLRAALDPVLDTQQRARLEQAAKLAPPIRAGGEGRPGEGPPPREGRGPPPRDERMGGRRGPPRGPPPDGPPPDPGARGRRGPPPDGRGPPPDGRGPPAGGGPPPPRGGDPEGVR
jgi:hypothetical protein